MRWFGWFGVLACAWSTNVACTSESTNTIGTGGSQSGGASGKDGSGATGGGPTGGAAGAGCTASVPLAFYAAEEDAKDSVGGYDGQIVGVPTWGVGHTGVGSHAFDFNAFWYVDVPFNDAFAIPSGFTVSAWVLVEPGVASDYFGVVAREDVLQSNPDTYRTFGIFLVPKEKCGSVNGGRPSASNANGGPCSNVDVADGEWHHLVATYDGSLMSIYVDKIMSGALSVAPAPTNGKEILRLGSNMQYRMIGLLDDVRIYSCALSSAEVVKLFDL